MSVLWETTEVEESALDWWKPQVVARRKLSGRTVRISSIALGVLLFLLAITGGWYLLQRPVQIEKQSLEALRQDTEELLDALPALESVAAAMGNSQAPDLGESTEVVLAAESPARRVFADAGSLDGTLRDTGVFAAGAILETTTHINRLLAYRLSAERTLSVPTLPDSPADTDLPTATEAVTAWRAEVETAAMELPTDVVPAHSRAVESWLGGLDEWQSRYLDGIRQSDPAAMQKALGDLENQIEGLHAQLLASLEEIGGELVGQIAEARSAAQSLIGA